MGGGYGAETFGYDANGNRTSTNGVANSYTANTNILTKIGTGTQTVTTNKNGNIIGIAYTTPMGFTYNQANRLASVTVSGGPVLSYLYDGLGRRINKTDTAQRFQVYDWMGRSIEQTDNMNMVKLDYIYLDGLPVATFVPSAGTAGTLSFLHTNRLGTPRLATNSSQAVGWNATTADPFDAPNTPAMGNTIANDLRMPGQEYEFSSGHNHNGFRDYAPSLGRYLESDPIGLGGGLNTYAYASNSPAKFFDLAGLSDGELYGPPAPKNPSTSPGGSNSTQYGPPEQYGPPTPSSSAHPGIVVNGTVCGPDFLCAGISHIINGQTYVDVGVGTPGASGSIVMTNDADDYCSGASVQVGNQNYKAGGASTSGNSIAIGAQSGKGGSITYGFPLSILQPGPSSFFGDDVFPNE